MKDYKKYRLMNLNCLSERHRKHSVFERSNLHYLEPATESCWSSHSGSGVVNFYAPRIDTLALVEAICRVEELLAKSLLRSMILKLYCSKSLSIISC